MKKHFALILLLSVGTWAFSQSKYTVTKSTITFKIKNLGVNTGGNISGFKGDIQFDPAHLDAGSIEASVETNTINTGNDTRDEHLRSDSYFDVAKYPKITIKSVSLKHKSGDSYTGTFNLTIKDKTNTVDIPFTYTETGNTASFKGTLQIKRSDYDVGGKSMIMSNDVNITIDVEAAK
ncbi:YceI family protein [Mucilaginibacter sp. McL0603]|uniref:YceI family protein n=1 Tax=Mucilaginibacter sp. McL0603 TaxID=3415670 RepID=UPI003CEB3711